MNQVTPIRLTEEELIRQGVQKKDIFHREDGTMDVETTLINISMPEFIPIAGNREEKLMLTVSCRKPGNWLVRVTATLKPYEFLSSNEIYGLTNKDRLDTRYKAIWKGLERAMEICRGRGKEKYMGQIVKTAKEFRKGEEK